MPELSEDRKAQLNSLRCGTCGHWHPFVSVCPYVKSQSIKIEPPRDGKRGTVQIIHTEYFERPDIAAQSIDSLDELDEMVPEPPEPQPEKAEEPDEPKFEVV